MAIMLRAITQAWHLATTAQRATWDELAAPQRISGIALYTKFNLDRWNTLKAASFAPTESAAPPVGSIAFLAPTPRLRTVRLLVQPVGTPNPRWMYIFRSTTTPIPILPENLVHAICVTTPGSYYKDDTPPAPGTYYYVGRRAYALGAWAAYTSTYAVTIPA
jgi:hypothetical protein